MSAHEEPRETMFQSDVNRAQFLRQAGLGAAGLALGGSLSGLVRPSPAAAALSFAGNALNVTYWGNIPHRENLTAVLKGFGKKYGVTVVDNKEPQVFGDVVQKFTTYLSSGSSVYDVYWLDEFMTATFSNAGWLEPLEGKISKETIDSIGSGPIQLSRYNGHLYRVPGYSGGVLFFYRKDLFDKTGLAVPKTWQDIVKAGQKLTGGGVYGIGFAGKNGNTELFNELCYWMGQAGASPLNLKTPAARKTLQFIYDMLHTYKIMPPNTVTADYTSLQTEFIDGRLAMWPVWAGFYSQFTSSASFMKKYKVAVGLPPRGPANNTTLVDSWGWSVAKYSKNKDLAAKFIEYACSAHSEDLLAQSGTVPARLSELSNPTVQKAIPETRFLALYAKQHLGRPRPITAQAQRISDALEAVINQYLNKQISLDTAITEAQQRIDQIRRNA